MEETGFGAFAQSAGWRESRLNIPFYWIFLLTFFFLFIIFFYLRSLLLSLFSLENVNSTNVPYSPGSFPPMFKIALTFLISELLLCPSIKQMIIFEKYLTSIWADLPSLICVCAPTP